MAVRRKSNWYIYFIAFGITLAMIIMAVISLKDYIFPESSETGTNNGTLSDDFVPDSGMNMAVLTMISDSDSDMPSLFIAAVYDAVENRLTFIPLTDGIALGSAGRTLPNIYAAQGGSGVTETVSDIIGINFDGYIRFTRSSLLDFLSAFGSVDYNVSKTLIVNDGAEVEAINSGRQTFTSETLFRYMMFADFGEGESYRFNMIGSILSELVNQNVSYIDSSLLDIYAQNIMENAETDLTEERYKVSRAAMLNTAQYGINPAEYYVPYGDYNDDGSFTISENSVQSIRQRAGQDQD